MEFTENNSRHSIDIDFQLLVRDRSTGIREMEDMHVAVIDVLQRASSQDPNILKTAEETLKQWETERGFYILLHNVFSNHSLDINVRWMAILCFKNGIDRYWRKCAPNAIAEDEKEFLRQHLLTNFEEPINQLALPLANSIAKIARYDCPREWSTLIPTLLDVIRGQNSLAQHRALLTLHHVIKTLATKFLPPDVQLFRELTINMFSSILHLWNSYTESFLMLTSNMADANQIRESLEKALLLLKILGKLTLYGHKKPSRCPDVMSFLKIIFERARACLECRKTLISRDMEMEVCDKFIIRLTKVLIGVSDMRPLCYGELIPTTLEFTVFYCFTEAGQALVFERFVIECFNLMKGILLRRGSRGERNMLRNAPSDTDINNPFAVRRLRAIQITYQFFGRETLIEICTKLVTHYFLLTPADLDLWDAEPESLVNGDNYELCKYSLRPCAESLFVEIFHSSKDVLVPVLVELMQKHHQQVDPNDLHAILLKDAVYNAVGLVAFELYDEVNFDQWLSTTLKEEMKIRHGNYRIIRRRICWLIGKWTTVRLSAELRPSLYELMIEVLNPEEDFGVRLAASGTLKLMIDDFQFNPEEFSPYLGRAFCLVFALLKEVKEYYAKMRVLYVLSYMIERVGSEIIPHVGVLTSYLPELWQQFESHNMLRCAIILTLVHLEKAFGPKSVVIEPFVIGVIAVSCDVNDDSYVYLLDDGLRLWLTLLENSPKPTPAMLNLTKYLPALIEQSYDYLKVCLDIIQAYAIKCPVEFLSQIGAVIIETLRSILGDLTQEAVVGIILIFEQCLYASPQGIELMKPALLTIFENMCKGETRTSVMTMYLSIVARVLWSHKDIFVQVVSELTRKIGGNEVGEEAVLEALVRMWVNKMPYIASLERRKLLAIALCSLLGANSPPSVMQYFPEIISNIVETLNDITKLDDEECLNMEYAIECMSIGEQPVQSHDDEAANDDDWPYNLKITFNDPMCSVPLKATLQNQLLTLRRIMGDNQFNQLMLTLNPEIDKELKLYVSL